MTSKERQRNFVLELRALTMKYGVAVHGCGCCGSPYLEPEADVTDDRAGYAIETDDWTNLRWVDPSDSRVWLMNKDEIIQEEKQP